MERFLDYFVPERYDLDLRINAEKTKLDSTAIIYGEAKTSTIKFHFVKSTVKRIAIDDLDWTDYAVKDGVLEIYNVSIVNHAITIKYIAPIETDMQGAYLSTYTDNEGNPQKIVATQFESHYARECFPCIDEPAAKATFKLSISTPDQEDQVISNMPAEFTTTQDGIKKVEFTETPRMSTYLVAFAVGKFVSYETTSKHGVKITTYAGIHQKAEDLQFAGDFAADVLDFYDDCFKTPFPLPKMDLLALPDFEAGAMENWGLVTFREIYLLANERSAFDHRQQVAIVIAHELSHMWFGDLVTMAWWNDLWLNESFANMMEVYSTDKIRPELQAWDDFVTNAILPSLQRDCLPGVQPVKVEVNNVEDISNLFDGAIVYGKGSRLMTMLMRTMGEENFFAGLADYFEKHAYGNTTAEDLWQALSPHADFDVSEFMMPWLTQSGYPVINSHDIDSQQRFLIDNTTDDTKYPIREIRDDLTGHYIINYTEAELNEKIANLDNLSKEQKIRLLMDRRLLAKTDRAQSVTLLPLLKAFAEHESDPLIWEILSVIVGDIKVFFEPKSDEKHEFMHFVRQCSFKHFQRLGIAEHPNDTEDDKQLRPIIMSMMHYAADEEYINAIDYAYYDKKIANVDQNLRWVIAATLVRRHPDLSKVYFNLYQKTNDSALKHDLADALTAVRDRETALSYLPKLMDGTVRPQDRHLFYLRLLRNYTIRDDAFEWAYKNWDWLYEQEGDKTIPDYPRYMAMYARTEHSAQRFKEFFKQHEDEPILSRDVHVAYTEIDARLHLINSDKQAIFDYLAEKDVEE